ncbi:alpha/beta hydrolase [Streptomyces sp. SID13031]|uniref:alpha/beta fold hydrolase n=1 Tax=Streptomyces sp. SID13031 TaxID=2706046 RepID=UPI001EF38956|nr:alpha/beta hydrolase [Streptomyces sp. SID13031]
MPHECVVSYAHGAQTHLVVAGSGTTTVVFVPGTNFNAAVSLPLGAALSRRYRVIIPDVPGQPGLSSDERDRSSRGLAWYGAWLDDVVELAADGGGPVVVMGHSFGGAIALSARSPAISGRVLVSSGGLCPLQVTPAILIASLAWICRPGSRSSARLIRAMSAPGREPRGDLVEWMTLVARHSRSSGAPGQATIVANTIPTVLTTGTRDVFVPPGRLAPAAHRKLGLEVDAVTDGGHLLVEECPEHLTALVDHLIVRHGL